MHQNAHQNEQYFHSYEVRFITVDENYDAQRLDNFLFRELKGVPKSHIHRIIRAAEVRINKGRARSDSRVYTGDIVRVPPIRVSSRGDAADSSLESEAERRARNVPAHEFPILFEDDCLLAIDKPAGVAVHGGSGVSFGVIEQLRRARPQSRYLELVHRLDRDTSGVLLLAKKASALKNLQNQFRERETHKLYLAVVTGQWPARKKVIDIALRKYLTAEGERRVQVVAQDRVDAMRAISVVRVLGVQGRDFSLLEVNIKTGRTHQIRVHLASAGHPIVGDDKYGIFELNRENHKRGHKRMFLHAHRLQFKHPVTGGLVDLLAQTPQAFCGLMPEFNFQALGD